VKLLTSNGASAQGVGYIFSRHWACPSGSTAFALLRSFVAVMWDWTLAQVTLLREKFDDPPDISRYLAMRGPPFFGQTVSVSV
jgi:hypothetical protein